MKKPIIAILKSGFNYGQEEELQDYHYDIDGKKRRWMYKPKDHEPEVSCCGTKSVDHPLMQLSKANLDLETFQQLLYDRLTRRSKGIQALRKVQLNYALSKIFEEKPAVDLY